MTRFWQSMAALAVITGPFFAVPAQGQQEWNPFREKDELAKRVKRTPEALPPPLPTMNGDLPRSDTGRRNGEVSQRGAPPGFGAAYPGSDSPPDYARPLPDVFHGPSREASNASKVERLDLEPGLAIATSAGTSGALPLDAWRGLEIKAVEEIFVTLNLPPRSAVLHGLWTRLLTSAADVPIGGQTPAHFEALRLEALYRSGLIGAMGARLQAVSLDDPVFQAFAIRRDLALTNRDAVCQGAKKLISKRAELPKALVGELHLLAGYCAAAEGNTAAAGVAADLAREEGVDAPVAIAALEALAGNGRGPLTPPKQVHVLDYRLLELLGPIEASQVLDRAEPALLAALALQASADARVRVAAGEAAARLQAISAAELTAIYQAAPADPEDAPLRRAELVRAISVEASPPRKLQLMKALLDDARSNQLLWPVARVLAPMLADVVPSPDLQAQADTAIEIALAAGDVVGARRFAMGFAARTWQPLIDIADQDLNEQQREEHLSGLDEPVRRGRFSADVLHRLATVLDATDVNVPLPLWEAASRTPQPATGFLPETGVLVQLQDAAKKKEVARSVLLAMRALGPGGADGAHIIALGDAIRALRRVGLDRDARLLGVEALIALWPRGGAS